MKVKEKIYDILKWIADKLKLKVVFAVMLIIILVKMFCFSSAHIDYTKKYAEERWEKQGFEVVDYEGYHGGLAIPFTSYGGANVWHRLKKIPDNGITYSGYLKRWGDEIHVYGPFALDAIKPQK